MGRRKDEAGYSLVEVLASIVLLSIAIIPMVTMFDVGLRAATRGGSYDQARAFAGEKLEEVKALPFKNSTSRSDSVVEVYPPGKKTMPRQGRFEATVTTAYQDVTSSGEYTDSRDNQGRGRSPGQTPTTRMKVTVTVTWDANSYTTTGLVTSGTR